jgi:Ser/Thr protein kinase RdoA (MazF antagonist)
MLFAERSRAAQVRLLRTTATEALARFPVDVRRLRLLSHGYNTTFRVDTADGNRYALRLNTSSRRTAAMIAGEMAWQAAIASDTDVRVPRPQPTSDGELVARVDCPHLGRQLSAVLYSWLPGPDLGDGITQDQMRAVGRTMATLHTHAETWQLPEGAELPVFDDPLLGDTDHLTDHPLPSAEQRAVLVAALEGTRRQYSSLFARTTPIALHADLHQWNTKWHRGTLSVFDFDDSGFGVPLQDLAITAYYVRRVDRALEDALHEGYATSRPAPKGTAAEYEANLASRNLVLLNDVLVSDNAELRAEAEHYLPLTVARLRHWLETGVFRFDLPATAAR